MKRMLFVVAMSVSALGAGLLACSDGDEASPGELADGGDGGGLTSGADATAEPKDAAPDAFDAGPRICSNDDFCHTVVPPKASLRAVWDDSLGTAWAVSDQGVVFRFDAGAWKQHTKLEGELTAVWGSGPNDVWIGGATGLFHGTGASPSSLVFAKVDLPGEPSPIASIWGTGPTDVWVVSGEFMFPLVGRILHYEVVTKAIEPSDAGVDAGDAGATDAGTTQKPEWTQVTLTKDSLQPLSVFGSAASGVWIGARRMNKAELDYEIALFRKAPGAPGFTEVALPPDPSAQGSPRGRMERLYGASSSPDGSTIALLGRSHTSTPAVIRGTSTNPAGPFTLAFGADGTYQEPEMHGVWASAANDIWTAGEYGRFRHWNGAKWKQAEITNTKFPVIAPLWGVWGDAKGRMWCVGDGIALHRDPPLPKP